MKIKKLTFLGSLVILMMVISLVAVAGCAPAPSPTPTPTPTPEPQVFEWKMQSLWPHGDLSMDALPAFAADVEKKSDGQLKISVFADGDIVPMDQLYQATGMGTLDMAHGGGMWAMVLPVADVEFGLAKMWDFPGKNFEEGAVLQRDFILNGGLADILRREYAKDDLYWLDLHTYGPSCCLTTESVSTQADIKGLKLGDTGGWQTMFHDMLGWAPSPGFPPGEVYMALKLGTLDSIMWDLSAITGLGWHEVAPYWVSNEGFTSYATGNMLVNMDSWNALPDDLKGVLAAAAEDYWQDTVDIYGEQLDIARQMVKDGDLYECVLDEAYVNQSNEVAYEVWAAAAAEDPASAEAIELIEKWKGLK